MRGKGNKGTKEWGNNVRNDSVKKRGIICMVISQVSKVGYNKKSLPGCKEWIRWWFENNLLYAIVWLQNDEPHRMGIHVKTTRSNENRNLICLMLMSIIQTGRGKERGVISSHFVMFKSNSLPRSAVINNQYPVQVHKRRLRRTVSVCVCVCVRE